MWLGLPILYIGAMVVLAFTMEEMQSINSAGEWYSHKDWGAIIGLPAIVLAGLYFLVWLIRLRQTGDKAVGTYLAISVRKDELQDAGYTGFWYQPQKEISITR